MHAKAVTVALLLSLAIAGCATRLASRNTPRSRTAHRCSGAPARRRGHRHSTGRRRGRWPHAGRGGGLALWNNPDFQVQLADMGFARADLLEAGPVAKSRALAPLSRRTQAARDHAEMADRGAVATPATRGRGALCGRARGCGPRAVRAHARLGREDRIRRIRARAGSPAACGPVGRGARADQQADGIAVPGWRRQPAGGANGGD